MDNSINMGGDEMRAICITCCREFESIEQGEGHSMCKLPSLVPMFVTESGRNNFLKCDACKAEYMPGSPHVCSVALGPESYCIPGHGGDPISPIHCQPHGQRVEDKIKWCKEFLILHKEIL